MPFAPKLNRGQTGSVLAAVGTLFAGLAVAAAPSGLGPWSTAFLLLAPLIPAAVLWRAVDPLGRLVLSGGAVVVVDAVVAEVMLVTGTWSQSAGVRAVAVVSAVMWVGNAASWNVMARGLMPSPQGHRPHEERAESRSS